MREEDKKWQLVRVYMKDGVVVETIPNRHYITYSSSMLEEKLALLKLAPAVKEVDGVGRRMNTNVFYVRFYAGEFTVPDEEQV